MNISPATQLDQALASAVEAINKMQMLGAESKAFADIALAIYHAQAAAEELPLRISESENRACVGCPYRATAVESLPYGERNTYIESHDCLAQRPEQCRQVTGIGYYPEIPDVPAYLKREAG